MGNFGPYLPTILLVLCLCGLAYYFIRRRRAKNPPGGHDR